ncbi:MAG: group III truncated hemoglobin [Crocinitomicaceae bacterium]|nr:group III truncated hemoglobin [Crocinitomicaceae bacterium]
MKRDLKKRKDIEKVVVNFYSKVNNDEQLSVFFNEVIRIDWNKHIPHMCDFWENVLFFSGNYEGNPLESHRNIHIIHKTQDFHFYKWTSLFEETIDEYFIGANANKMKTHARSIAEHMQKNIEK